MSERKDILKGYLSVLFTALLWSTGGIFIKLIPWAALSINAGRCAVAFLFKIATRRSLKIKFTAGSILGGLAVASTMTLFVFANKLTTAANAITLQYSFPMFLILFFWIFGKKKPRWADISTSTVILLGVFFCCFDKSGKGAVTGNLLAVASGISFAAYFYFTSLSDSSPDDANCIGFLLGLFAGLPSLMTETDFSLKPVLFTTLLGALQVGLAYVLFEYGIKRVPAISASFISAIEPVMSPVWVAVFYGEKIGPYAVLGSVLVIASMVFYNIANLRRPKTE